MTHHGAAGVAVTRISGDYRHDGPMIHRLVLIMIILLWPPMVCPVSIPYLPFLPLYPDQCQRIAEINCLESLLLSVSQG